MFQLRWVESAAEEFSRLEKEALTLRKKKSGKQKSSQQEGLFKQVFKTIQLLSSNPRHPSLHTHEYTSLRHPYDSEKKVFEAYAQNKTPGAYRVFWCYGPKAKEITILAITPHP